jgi:predicted O-methyltransferase YrrM
MTRAQPFLDRDFYSDPRRRARSAVVRLLSRPMRRAGFDFEVRSFYSPIPDLTSIGTEIWERRSDLPGIPLDLDRQLAFVEEEVARYVGEFAPQLEGSVDGFHLRNGLFQGGDAELLYALVRLKKPSRIVELGAGYSTLVSAAAARANRTDGHDTRVVSFDPYASPAALGGMSDVVDLVPQAAEGLDPAYFSELAPNDILFIDSSHTVRIGGDVVYLLCEVIPRLGAGVLVHLHDIFLPYEYPREWLEHNRWYWAEQYLLQALLADNRRLEVLVACHALWRERRERLEAAFPSIALTAPPLSFWMGIAGSS